MVSSLRITITFNACLNGLGRRTIRDEKMKIMNIFKTTVVFLLFTASVAHANIIVTFAPSTTDVAVGDTFTVDVLANADLVDAFLAFEIGFNLDADITTLGSSFVAPGATFFDVAGFVDNFPLPPLPISGVNILLATLTFTATSAGDLILNLDGGSFSGFGFVEFESRALNISVNEVSAPASLSLFTVALIAFAGFRRKA